MNLSLVAAYCFYIFIVLLKVIVFSGFMHGCNEVSGSPRWRNKPVPGFCHFRLGRGELHAGVVPHRKRAS